MSSILAKITAALHSSKENSPSPRHLDAFDPFRDPDYDSGDSDLEGMDADDIDSEDDSDADYDDDEKSQDDEEEDDDDDDCDDEDDDESDDDGDNLDDNDEEYADKEGDDELKSTEQRVEKKASLDSPRPPHSGGKSSLVSAEKSIMKPSMWPNYPLLLKVMMSFLIADMASSGRHHNSFPFVYANIVCISPSSPPEIQNNVSYWHFHC